VSDAVLAVLLAGAEIGSLRQDAQGRAAFRYRDEWRASRSAFPLSLALPLAARDHPPAVVEPFLWGLLPDNERTLDRWARRFQVSARNAFGLLSHVGEDCAGAVQFVRPERLDALTSAPAEIQWLDEVGVAERLRALRTDPAAWRGPDDLGQFSLAGAQPKTALLYEDGRWGVPSGRVPTTHILKPPAAEFDGHAENEHLCLRLARDLGLPAASSAVRRFGGEVAIVVERYDRARTASLVAAVAAEASTSAAEAALHAASAEDDQRAAVRAARAAANTAAAAARAEALSALAEVQPILRLHQEDACQALGVMPTAKYQSDGGPSPETIIELLRTHSSRPDEDVRTFVDALALNWLIAGTDAHAKNYSLLHGTGGRVRLAPLYDVASALPYAGMDPKRLRLAMKIGGAYRLRDIGPRQWRAFAQANRLDADVLLARLIAMADAVAERAPAVGAAAAAAGLDHPILATWAAALVERAKRFRLVLDRGGHAADPDTEGDAG
jgi:serine/threonine-protein kinase HipA